MLGELRPSRFSTHDTVAVSEANDSTGTPMSSTQYNVQTDNSRLNYLLRMLSKKITCFVGHARPEQPWPQICGSFRCLPKHTSVNLHSSEKNATVETSAYLSSCCDWLLAVNVACWGHLPTNIGRWQWQPTPLS